MMQQHAEPLISLPFFHEKLYSSSYSIRSLEVAARIEAFVSETLRHLVKGNVLSIKLASIQKSNAKYSSEDNIRLGTKKSSKSVNRNPVGYTRIWSCLDYVHRLSVENKISSQRAMYYHLIEIFDSQSQSNDVIAVTFKEISRLLECPRHSLRIYADERGSLTGCVSLKTSSGQWIDCERLPTGGRRISMLETYVDATSSAKCILIVEKDAIFQRLSEDRIFKMYPCILLTARGLPDLATRHLTKFLAEKLHLPVYILVDYNGGGVEIFLTYRTGSLNKGIESYHYSIKASYLGLSQSDIESQKIPEESGIPFTNRNRRKLETLMAHPLVQKSNELNLHIQKMLSPNSRKYELEAVYSKNLSSLLIFVVRKLFRKDIIC